METIDHYVVATRRGKPSVEGYRRSNGHMIHLYIKGQSNGATGSEVVCSETNEHYELGKPK